MEQNLGEREGTKWNINGYAKMIVLFEQDILIALYEDFMIQCLIINVEVLNLNLQLILTITQMSAELIEKEQVLNRRQLYKNQKLQQINQIYYCECGKNYLTFSALYLHARNKHEVKLTTKRTPQNCKVEQKEEKTIVTYFIQDKSTEQHLPIVQSPNKQSLQNSEEKNQRYASMVELVDAYLGQDSGHVPSGKSFCKAIIEQLGNYFRQLQEIEAADCPAEGESITLFFNDFISYYLPLAHEQKIISLYALGQAENELIKFWRWLRERKHTGSQLLHRTYPAPFFTS